MFLRTKTKTILVIGGSSFIGQACVRFWADKYSVRYTYFANELKIPRAWGFRLDMRNEPRICELFAEVQPDIVVQAAAMTSVAECEKEWERAYDTNVRATQDIMALCRQHNAQLILLSTDMVFDGNKGDYEEADKCFPGTRYGKTKKMAEELVAVGPHSPHLVLRLSLVYGLGRDHARGFIGWLHDALVARKPVQLFTDEWRTPVYLEDVVKLLDEAVEKNITGLYHVGGREKINRYEFGLRYANVMGYNPACIVAASIKDYREGPPRPADLSLNTALAQQKFRTHLAGVDDGLQRMKKLMDATAAAQDEESPSAFQQPDIAESDILG